MFGYKLVAVQHIALSTSCLISFVKLSLLRRRNPFSFSPHGRWLLRSQIKLLNVLISQVVGFFLYASQTAGLSI